MDGTERRVRSGRPPLEMEDGKNYLVVLRGLGRYFGGPKTEDFKRGGKAIEGERIENVAVVVCSTTDVEEEYVYSASVDTVLADDILAMAVKDENGVVFLKEELLNVIGKMAVVTTASKKGYDRGYRNLYFTPDLDKKGNMVKMAGAPDSPSLVGSAQRGEDEGVESSGEGVI